MFLGAFSKALGDAAGAQEWISGGDVQGGKQACMPDRHGEGSQSSQNQVQPTARCIPPAALHCLAGEAALPQRALDRSKVAAVQSISREYLWGWVA